LVEVRKRRPVERLDRNTLESVSSRLAEEILARLEEVLDDSLEEASVNVRVSDEWPYLLEVEVFARTRYPRKGVEEELQRVLDDALEELEALLGEELKQGSNSAARGSAREGSKAGASGANLRL
jgi:vacuolar-type H+-ATPase subunit E/Vma4